MDYNDPNTDFDLEAANLIAALRQAQAQQATKLPEGQIIRGSRNQLIYQPAGVGSTLGAAADQVFGGLQAAKLQRQQRELSAAQQNRMAELSGQLGQPGGGDPLAENARRMQIAQQMSRLPQARGLGTELWKQAADFPEKYAEQQARAQAQAAAQAERLQAQQQMQQDRLLQQALLMQTTNALKSRGLDIQQQGMDVRKNASEMQAMDLERKVGNDEAKREKLAEETKARQTAALDQLDNLERNVNMVIDPAGKLTKGAKSYLGQWDQYFPDALQGKETSTAGAAFEGLTNQLMLKNLADQRKAVGQSFGSMQLKEWDKFVNLLTTLQRGKDQSATEANLNYVRNYIKNNRNVLEFALGGGAGAAQVPAATSGKATTAPVTLNGKRYLNINGKWFEQ